MNRLILQACSAIFRSGEKRADYYRKKSVFGSIGNNVMIQDFRIPYNPKHVYIGNNVRLASGVRLITHDVAHKVLNNIHEFNYHFKEKEGMITIGDNVFVGADVIIMYDVNIGNNVVIGAGSVVTKDLPSNSVCVGNPCRKIDSFENFVEKRKSENGEAL